MSPRKTSVHYGLQGTPIYHQDFNDKTTAHHKTLGHIPFNQPCSLKFNLFSEMGLGTLHNSFVSF